MLDRMMLALVQATPNSGADATDATKPAASTELEKAKERQLS